MADFSLLKHLFAWLALLISLNAYGVAESPTEPSAMQPATVITVDKGFTSQQVGQGVEYWVESNDALTPLAVLGREKWSVYENESLNFGFSSEPRWIRFRINNAGSKEKELLVEIDNPYLDYIDIYTFSETGEQLKHAVLGDKLPATERAILHSKFISSVTIPAQAHRDLLLRVETISTNRIPIELWDTEYFIEQDYQRFVMKSLLYGGLVAIGIYHLMLFFSVKEKAYLYFCTSVFGMLCVILSSDGISTALLWPSSTNIGDHFILLGICGAIASTSVFSQIVLKLWEKKYQNMAVNTTLVISIGLGVSAFFAPYQLILKLALGLAFVQAVLQIFIYFNRLFEGYEPAKYVSTGIVVAATGIIINILTVTGRLPSHPLGINAAAIGTIFAVLFYAFALSNRMILDRTLREEAQLKLTRDLDLKVRERSEALQQANEQLLEVSITDGLTSLLNRRRFDEIYSCEYKRAYRQKQSIAVLMIDIDFFKKINDNYGHQFGDLCLREVAARITDCLNRPPDICARYGGEEFVIVLPNTALDGAIKVAETINHRVATEAMQGEGVSVKATVSVGVSAVVPESKEAQELLLKQADEYLYAAKEKGRDCVIHA